MLYNSNMNGIEEENRVDSALDYLITKEKGIGTEEPTAEEKERFLGGYSFGAFVYSTVYFMAMGDKLLAGLSLFSGIIFSPLIAVFPFVARRRAWQIRHWQNFNEFEVVQKRWDRAGLYGIIICIFLLFMAFQYIFRPMASTLLSSSPDLRLDQLLDDLNFSF